MSGISAKNKIDYFVKELSRRKPSPGGGAAAALTGALGAALIVKAANYTLGKKKYKRYEKEAEAILKKAEALTNGLSAHIEKDARIYSRYAKTGRKASLKDASDCASEISKLSAQGLKFCGRLRRIGNKNFKGDLAAAGLFLRASEKAADNLAKLNKKYLKSLSKAAAI